MISKSVVCAYGLLGMIAPVATVAKNASPKTKVQAVEWSLQGPTCHDQSSGDHPCLEKSKKDKIAWRIRNRCKDAVFQFTLKDKEPVTDCTIAPKDPTFSTIESPFSIPSGRDVTITCIVFAEALEKSCGGVPDSKYKYRIKIVKGGSLGGSAPPDVGPLSHELDIGVNP